MSLFIKIIRNIVVGLFLIYSGFQQMEIEKEKEIILLEKFTEVEILVSKYEIRKVQLGFILRTRGFLTATNGKTYLTDDTFVLKKNDPTEFFKKEPITIWLKKFGGDEMIYQMQTSMGIVIPFSSTLSNDEVPKMKGAYLLIGLGLFFTVVGFIAAFFFNKETKNEN